MRNIIKKKVSPSDNKQEIFCTTCQMDDFFDQFARGKLKDSGVMNYIQHFFCTQLIEDGDLVLDVCCGRGMLLPLLAGSGKKVEYTGIDISRRNLNEAKKYQGKIKAKWIKGNVLQLNKYFDKKADVIVYTSSIEHMHPDDGIKSLEQCKKALKSDGLLILSTPNTYHGGYKTRYRAHIYEWNYDEIKKTAEDMGFVIMGEYGLLGDDKLFRKKIADRYGKGILKYLSDVKKYLPSVFFNSFFAVPFAKEADEILFVLKIKK